MKKCLKRYGHHSGYNKPKLVIFLIFLSLLHFAFSGKSQIKTTTVVSDSNRSVEIIRAAHFRQLWFNDTTELQTLSGYAVVKQASTILEGDSMIINKRLGLIEVFGHAHVNDADTIHAHADYLRYESDKKMAYLNKAVKITDGKATLYTEQLDYNTETGVGIYKQKGKVVQGKTILTSDGGTYYADTHDVFFEGNVRLKDPQYQMSSERLRYNSERRMTYFIAPTQIDTKNGKIDTRDGYYNMETGEAIFNERPVFRDSSQQMTGDKIAVDEKNNVIQVEGNGKFTDTKQNMIVVGDQLLIDRKNQTFLATRKPVMILYDQGDSTFINADTLYSGKRIEEVFKLDQKIAVDTIQYFLGFHHVRIYNDSVQAVGDSLHYSSSDSLFKLTGEPICWNGKTQLSGDTMHLQMARQQPKKLDIFNNAMVVHFSREGIFDQMQGKQLEGFFEDGQLNHIKTKGSPAESIFYPQDEDSNYMGMNKSQSQWIEFFLKNKELETIRYSNDVKGTMYPFGQMPEGENKLKGFYWKPDKRPVNKFELFY
jgi:lipopolysaccharide export system protein LptA